MFGNKKSIKKVAAKKAAEAETPDLVVPIEQEVPKNMGMPGFTADPEPEKVVSPTPEPVAQPTEAPAVSPLATAPAPAPVAPAPAPAPEPVVEEEYQVVAAELMSEGLYRYVIITNKNLGEIGGVYKI